MIDESIVVICRAILIGILIFVFLSMAFSGCTEVVKPYCLLPETTDEQVSDPDAMRRAQE